MRKLSVVGNWRTVSYENSLFKTWKHQKRSLLPNFKDCLSFHRHLLPVDREGDAGWAVTPLGTCVALMRCRSCLVSTACAMLSVRDSTAAHCYWCCWWEMEHVASVPLHWWSTVSCGLQISTLSVPQYLLLVVQPVVHMLSGFPRPVSLFAHFRCHRMSQHIVMCYPYTHSSEGLPKVYISMQISSKPAYYWPLGEGGWDGEKGKECAQLPCMEDCEVCLGAWICALSRADVIFYKYFLRSCVSVYTCRNQLY